jgi:hypothetical protein
MEHTSRVDNVMNVDMNVNVNIDVNIDVTNVLTYVSRTRDE